MRVARRTSYVARCTLHDARCTLRACVACCALHNARASWPGVPRRVVHLAHPPLRSGQSARSPLRPELPGRPRKKVSHCLLAGLHRTGRCASPSYGAGKGTSLRLPGRRAGTQALEESYFHEEAFGSDTLIPRGGSLRLARRGFKHAFRSGNFPGFRNSGVGFPSLGRRTAAPGTLQDFEFLAGCSRAWSAGPARQWSAGWAGRSRISRGFGRCWPSGARSVHAS